MLPARAGSRGNSAKTFSIVHGSRGAAAIGGGGDKIFARSEIGKHLTSLRHQSEPELGNAIRRQRADVGAGEADRARKPAASVP